MRTPWIFIGVARKVTMLFLALYLIIHGPLSAQIISATLKADSNQILIGDHLNIKLVVKYANDLMVVLPPFSDTLGNMDVLNASKVDTSVEGNFKILTRTYTVSAYDSGKYHTGPVKIYFKDRGGLIDSVMSDAVPVLVNTLEVDTAKPFKAIKAPLDVPYSWKEFIPHIIAGILLLAAIAGGIFYWRKRSKRKPMVIERPRPKDPAHIWARKELQKLEEEKLWQKDEVKQFYSRLTDILRMYLEYRYDWFALESTTEEIEENIDRYHVKHKAKDSLMQILRSADLVKFAKMLPLPDANMRAMEAAYKFIDFTELKAEKPEEKINV
ncbi:MAG: hypothetical protein IPP77_04350 [Bacteroidetes bacterium]|nr:hypothetical protein [Bacteroidota bacterium]